MWHIAEGVIWIPRRLYKWVTFTQVPLSSQYLSRCLFSAQRRRSTDRLGNIRLSLSGYCSIVYFAGFVGVFGGGIIDLPLEGGNGFPYFSCGISSSFSFLLPRISILSILLQASQQDLNLLTSQFCGSVSFSSAIHECLLTRAFRFSL